MRALDQGKVSAKALRSWPNGASVAVELAQQPETKRPAIMIHYGARKPSKRERETFEKTDGF